MDKVLKMRNPYGTETYNGKWADGEQSWTPFLLNALEHKPGNDGTFYMPFNDFRHAFHDY